MTLYLYTRPIKNSLFDDFEDDFFNYPITKKHHFGIRNPRFIHCHHGKCNKQISTLEKQLSRALKNNELFEIVEFSPKINISEDEKNYYVHADLPGMTKDQVKMELNEDHILTISGERKSTFNYNNNNNNNNNNNTENKDNKNSENGKSENNEMETKNMTEDKNKNKEDNETETENIEKKESNENNKSKSKETIKLEENNKVKYNIMECNYGKFSRSFSIPEDANIENVKAKMENGVLEVVFNKIKPQKHQNRTIQIQ